jgi:hypothetical protein
MGVVDELWIKLTCKTCKHSETKSALDYGSVYRGSNWGSLGRFTKFDVICEGQGEKEPTVISAKCRACGKVAIVEKSYGPS